MGAGTRELLDPVDLGPGVVAAFTTRAAGNLAHRRPHLPSRLARSRRTVEDALGLDAASIHLMQQVHGAAVATVDQGTVPGAELRGVDGVVTDLVGRPLSVQVADCVPILVAAASGPVAAIHAGRRGLVGGVVEATLEALAALLPRGERALRAAIGPSIGGCCYEVPADLQDDVADRHPAARSTTTWGTPSLDLPAAVRALLEDGGVEHVIGPPGCTRCDDRARWFSHRADPAAGRQLGIVVRQDAA